MLSPGWVHLPRLARTQGSLLPTPLGALCSTGSLFAFAKCEQELGAPKGCLIFITTAKNLCHSLFQHEFDGAV